MVGEPTNCYTGNEWDQELCADAASCTENCALDGIDDATWEGTYGVNIEGSDMTLSFVTQGPYSRNVGSRTYLLDESGQSYVKFMLLNQEFSFDVDVSNLPCGINGAFYLVEMDADGGMSYPTNDCGAQYGTGYCDAQCPHDMKWTCGKPIAWPKLILPILVKLRDNTDAKEQNVVTMLLMRDTMGFVTRMVVISLLSVWEMKISMDLVSNSTPTHP